MLEKARHTLYIFHISHISDNEHSVSHIRLINVRKLYSHFSLHRSIFSSTWFLMNCNSQQVPLSVKLIDHRFVDETYVPLDRWEIYE